MTTLSDFSALTLRRDRGLGTALGDAAFGSSLLFFTYVVELDGKTVLHITNDYTLSQAFFGNFGGFSLSVLDNDRNLQFVVRHQGGLTAPMLFVGPTGEPLGQTAHSAGDSAVDILDAAGKRILYAKREGNPLFPTYSCLSDGVQLGVVDSKFDGLNGLFNKGTRYNVTFAPGTSEAQRRAVLCVGLFMDIQLGGS